MKTGLTAATVLAAMIALSGPAAARLGIAPTAVSQDDAVIQVRGGGHGSNTMAGTAIITVGSEAGAIRTAIAEQGPWP